MESLRKLKNSIIGVPKDSLAREYMNFIVKALDDMQKDYPNDTELGEEMRRLIHLFVKHYNM